MKWLIIIFLLLVTIDACIKARSDSSSTSAHSVRHHVAKRM